MWLFSKFHLLQFFVPDVYYAKTPIPLLILRKTWINVNDFRIDKVGWIQIMKQFSPFSCHMFPLKYIKQQNIQIIWTQIWSHNSTCNALWEDELCFSCILSYFSTSRVIVIISITYPRVHYTVNTLWVSICSCCWYELYAEVLRQSFQ
jgi:hypothetical protein